VGAAKNVAVNFLKFGYEETLATVPQDRKIQVSKHWPGAPSPVPSHPETKTVEAVDSKRVVEI
jgi:hypothetical protein